MAEHTCHFCSRRAFSDEDNPALSIEPQAAKVQPVARALAPIRAEVSRHRGAHPKREFSGNTQTIERRNAQRDIHHHNDDPLPRSPPDWQKSHDSSQTRACGFTEKDEFFLREDRLSHQNEVYRVMHAHYHIVEGGVTQRMCHAF